MSKEIIFKFGCITKVPSKWSIAQMLDPLLEKKVKLTKKLINCDQKECSGTIKKNSREDYVLHNGKRNIYNITRAINGSNRDPVYEIRVKESA